MQFFMNQIVPTLKRKLRKAYQLTRAREWGGLGRRLIRSFSALMGPLGETYWLGRDAVVHAYWQVRGKSGRMAPDVSGAFSISTSGASDSQRKNIIWIMLDALRQDIFAEYLSRGGLPDLVENGAYFSQAFAQGSWTYPSVFSFLTGRYPFNCGVSQLVHSDGNLFSLCADFDDTCPTIFSMLREEEYQVASVLDGWGFTIRHTAGQGHREDRYFEQNWGWTYGQGQRFLTLAEQREATLDYVRRVAPDGPFMLFVRSLYTHSPYREIFKSSDYVTRLSQRRRRFPLVEGFIRGLAQFETQYMEPLLETLEQVGQDKNTIIVLCSDHGDMFWNVEDDLRSGKIDDDEVWRHQLEPYNALVKVPLLVSGASFHGHYGKRFRLVDLAPTLLEEVDVGFDVTEFDGVSIRQNSSRPLYADSAGYGNGGIAFQDTGPKLLLSRRLGAVAYDISADEFESLALRREANGEVAELINFVQRTNRFSTAIIAKDNQAHDDALTRRLRALGYL